MKLRKCYNIIKDLHKRGKVKVTREVLDALDFDFEVLTFMEYFSEEEARTVYDIYSYRMIVTGNIIIIKKL